MSNFTATALANENFLVEGTDVRGRYGECVIHGGEWLEIKRALGTDTAKEQLDAAIEEHDWSGFGHLVLTLDNPGEQSLELGVRLDDDPSADGRNHCIQATIPVPAKSRITSAVVIGPDPMSLGMRGLPGPVGALFAWLRGVPETAEGWQVDLSQQAGGRLRAWRLAPPPSAELRVVLDAP